MRDPYEVLGVERQASSADIKSAYRRLAKRFHPDRAPGDAQMAERFHEISAAYDFLRNDRKRRRFDAGEIDASGRRRRFGNWEFEETSGGPGHDAWKAGFANGAHEAGNGTGEARPAEDLNFKFSSSEREEAFRSQSIFSELFGNLRGTPRIRRRGADVTYRLNVSLEEAACGAVRRVRLPAGKRLDVRIPAGSESGQQIRLKEQGEPGENGGPAGDALIILQIEPHPVFRREGRNIHMKLDVSLPEAVLGANITVPTIAGPVSMTVPPGSNTGTVLRVRGKGIAPAAAAGTQQQVPGDHLVTLRVILPDSADAEFVDFIRRWATEHAYKVRDENPATHERADSSEE